MLSYYVIYYEKFRKVMQQTEMEALIFTSYHKYLIKSVERRRNVRHINDDRFHLKMKGCFVYKEE